MGSNGFDVSRLTRKYDIQDIRDSVALLKTVKDFTIATRSNKIDPEQFDQCATPFVHLVDDPDVWHLVEMVVPEFREALSISPNQKSPSQLQQILQLCTHRLPQSLRKTNILTDEQVMLRDRNEQAIEYLETGGKGRAQGTEEQLKSSAKLAGRVQTIRTFKENGGIPQSEPMEQQDLAHLKQSLQKELVRIEGLMEKQ